MATSSIFANVVIDDSQTAENFIHALEVSDRQPEWKPTASVNPPLSDIDEIRKRMGKGTKAYGQL